MTEQLYQQIKHGESIVTDAVNIDEADQPHVFAQHVGKLVQYLLESAPATQRHSTANRIIDFLNTADESIHAPQHLTRLVTDNLGHEARYTTRPATPLNEAALLTNGANEPNLGSEIRAEIASSDQVDLLCAFVKWYGIRVIEDELRDLRDRGGRFRVITTTYIGATEPKALDRLVEEFGAQVRINYNETNTRLHAKAWLFRRNSGFDTAYVGSSNLSRTALLDGLEWNVRLSGTSTPHLVEKFDSTFETYWNDPAFETYDPSNVKHRDRLDGAIAQASGKKPSSTSLNISGLEVRPYPYQQHILDMLQSERETHIRHRNLVVAATGTGKTVMAALDYKRLADVHRRRYPSLLFIAHRKEILEQSLRTYREVLSDATFGELYVGGSRPERWQHVFASIQSLNSYGIDRIPPDAFDVVVIDEFHHAAAPSYHEAFAHLQPKELLALTATPERSDGFDVRAYFDGRIAAELRIWEALQQGILSPFHYFLVSDGTDLTRISWKRGGYDIGELENLYTGNDARTRIVLKELSAKVLDTSSMRAIGFCVSVAHARYMTEAFTDAGITAATLTGETPLDERSRILEDLAQGATNIVFTVDLLNEGVDIPDVDTLLFLRPTESATLFLQQLGRGLRQRPDKPVLTVLDFVGNQRQNFRFDQRLGALTGKFRRALIDDVAEGFPSLPSGCQIVMDEVSQQVVLTNLRDQIQTRWPKLVSELRSSTAKSLADFLDSAGLALSDVIRRKDQTWTQLQRQAGRQMLPAGPQESQLSSRIRAFTHIQDPKRYRAYRQLVENPNTQTDPGFRDMLFYSLWPTGGGHASPKEGLMSLQHEPALVDELLQVLDLSFESADRPTRPLPGSLAFSPIQVHAQYQREEILAGLGWTDSGKKPSYFVEGVTYVEEHNIDILLVTLRKSEARFSPTTMYRDYPISRELFHWESQSNTALASQAGQRYVTNASTVLLFVREAKTNEFGTAPYYCLGRARNVAHKGERPIAITWKLDTPIPADLFSSWAVAASA